MPCLSSSPKATARLEAMRPEAPMPWEDHAAAQFPREHVQLAVREALRAELGDLGARLRQGLREELQRFFEQPGPEEPRQQERGWRPGADGGAPLRPWIKHSISSSLPVEAFSDPFDIPRPPDIEEQMPSRPPSQEPPRDLELAGRLARPLSCALRPGTPTAWLPESEGKEPGSTSPQTFSRAIPRAGSKRALAPGRVRFNAPSVRNPSFSRAVTLPSRALQARRSLRKTALGEQAGGRTVQATKDYWRSILVEIFDYTISVFILMNGIFIGIQTDYMATHSTDAVPAFFRIGEMIFCVIFFVELLIRLSMHRLEFFTMPGWKWNVFDLTLVGMQMCEVCGMLFFSYEKDSSPSTNISFLRILRILRLLRVLRLVRLMQFIGELNVIISSVALSYKMGIYRPPTKEGVEELSRRWGSMGRSFLSLYEAVLGGIDWDDLAWPLAQYVSPLMALLFAMYIAFALLAMMNVITGVFVESALKNAEMEKNLDFLRVARDFFERSDLDANGTISYEEFEMQLDHPHFKSYVSSLGIDVDDALLLFKLLDKDNSGSIDLPELFDNMLRLQTGAKFMDVQKLAHTTEILNERWGSWSAAMEQQVGLLHSRLDKQLAKLDKLDKLDQHEGGQLPKWPGEWSQKHRASIAPLPSVRHRRPVGMGGLHPFGANEEEV